MHHGLGGHYWFPHVPLALLLGGLFHYLPGTMAFSLATAGCNVNCKFCQNWEISQVRPEQVTAYYMPPQIVAGLARQNQCPTIAYTYSEPVVFSEFLMDTADAGHEIGIRSVVVSNGYMQADSMVVADEFRDTLAGIYPGIGGAEGQPKAEPPASSADRRWHVHDVPGLALALASGLGDGGAAGFHRSGQHGVHRAWPRTAAARLFLLCAGDAAAGVAAFRSFQHRGLAHCLR